MDNVQSNRRLAAILAADVVGYSRLMAEDEAGTLAALTEHRQARFNPIVARHHGRVVKLMGDGTSVKFSSALKVQLTLAEKIKIREIGTTNVEAHDLYLRAVSMIKLADFNAERSRQVLDYCQQAQILDPKFTHAYAVLQLPQCWIS
jgi:class 3 adenylate cyclase